MIRSAAMAALGISLASLSQSPAQTFETSSIKLSPSSEKGFSFKYVSTRQFTANNHTLRECIGFAYDLNPALVSGGPAWLDSERYDITGLVPGDTRPPNSQLLLMFQALLADRLKLAVHREQKEEPVYDLVLGDSELKLKEDTAHTNQGAPIFKFRLTDARTMFLPARNANMAGFASLLQRSVLDRPVLDRTGLSGRYDFDLEWRVDGTQLESWATSGNQQATPRPNDESASKPDIFTAVRQLGLKLQSANESVDVIAVDHVERLNAN